MTPEVIEPPPSRAQSGCCRTEPDGKHLHTRGDPVMTETTPSTPIALGLRAVEQYVAFWNAGTADEQKRFATEAFADGVSYHVPVGVMRGADELIAFRNQFAQHQPDYSFRPRTEPEAHHNRARLQWELITGGEVFATGTDVLETDDDGRIVSISGFVDQAPAGFDPHAHH